MRISESNSSVAIPQAQRAGLAEARSFSRLILSIETATRMRVGSRNTMISSDFWELPRLVAGYKDRQNIIMKIHPKLLSRVQTSLGTLLLFGLTACVTSYEEKQ